jgi:hypothetical protein
VSEQAENCACGRPQHPVICERCFPEQKPARHYALRDPLPDDCPIPPALRFTTGITSDGPYMMCDDCAAEGASWFVLQEGN